MEEIKDPWFKEGLRFKCTGCGKCCTGSPGYVFLSPSDQKRLENHLSLDTKIFKEKYTQQVDSRLSLIDQPGSTGCIFLKDNQCSVYEARPTQCRTFPWWIQMIDEPKNWEESKERCEGINHPDAPLVPSIQIQVECLTYLDNLLEQNFY